MDGRVGGKRRQALSGQSVVEFSLVSLVLLLIVFGTIDLGRAVFVRSMLTNAVREAARNGSIYPATAVEYPDISGTSGMVAAAQRRSPSMNLSASNFTTVRCLKATDTSTVLSCSVSGVANSAVVGNLLEVCATYTYVPAATRLIRISSIAMRECSRIAIH
jgi:Flp pilus assembly protein TadG